MIFYAVDDEPLQLKMLTRAITDAEPNCELHSFTYAEELLTAMDEGCSAPEVAFLDIELPDMGGLELAYHIKKRAPKTNIAVSYTHLKARRGRPDASVSKGPGSIRRERRGCFAGAYRPA